MTDINLEKVDLVRERTGASYAEAKEALELCNGDVVEALVFLEAKKKSKNSFYATKDELMNWLKELINKGNATRIKLKKDDKVLVDLPINAGIAVTGITAALSAPLFAIGVLSAVVTKITVEITKEDGSVEVVNTYLKSTMGDVKDKFEDITDKLEGVTNEVKDKFNSITDELKDKFKVRSNSDVEDNNVYKYTVKFEEVNEENNKVNEENNEVKTENNEEKSDK